MQRRDWADKRRLRKGTFFKGLVACLRVALGDRSALRCRKLVNLGGQTGNLSRCLIPVDYTFRSGLLDNRNGFNKALFGLVY